MTESRSTKSCPSCMEPVDTRAVICPHCGSPQSARALWFKRHWIISACIGVLGFYAAIMPVAFIIPHGNRGLESYDGQLTITSSRMATGQADGKPVIAILGTIRNDSDLAWKNMHLQADFHDARGKLVDVHSDNYGRYLVRVPARAEIAFKMSFTPQFPAQEYVSYKVSIISAEDARSFP